MFKDIDPRRLPATSAAAANHSFESANHSLESVTPSAAVAWK